MQLPISGTKSDRRACRALHGGGKLHRTAAEEGKDSHSARNL